MPDVDTPLLDPKEEELLRGLLKSRYWRWLREVLIARRDALWHEDTKDTNTLWQNKGAIRELTRLLNAPESVLRWYLQQRRAAFDEFSDTDPAPTGSLARPVSSVSE